MKLSALSLPLFLSGLLCVAVWSFSQLTVQAGKTATHTSLELLRQQIEIQRLQEQLAARGRDQVLEQLQGLSVPQSPEGEGPRGERPVGDATPAPPESLTASPMQPPSHFDTSRPQPWPTP